MAKNEASRYLGEPSCAWLKVKLRQEAECVVGAVLVPDGQFAGILVGTYRNGRLCCLRLVQYRFRRSTLAELLTRAKPLVGRSSSFADHMAQHGGVWLTPRLRAEITFAEVMQGWLRDPMFRKLVMSEPGAP